MIKLFFHVTADRQLAVLRDRQQDEWRRHLLREEDLARVGQRERTIDVLHDLFRQTDTRWAPWQAIDANDPVAAQIGALAAIAGHMEKALPSAPPAVGDTIVPFALQQRG